MLPDHVAQLRQIAMDARNVEDIGYFRDGRLVCTSLGPIRQHVPARRPTSIWAGASPSSSTSSRAPSAASRCWR
ncbi:CSS-motif domain-containing protein [Rhizorhabdus histidinilytica]